MSFNPHQLTSELVTQGAILRGLSCLVSIHTSSRVSW